MPARYIDMMMKATNGIIGERGDRGVPGEPGNHKPQLNDGIYSGGVPWERSQRAKNLAKGPRAYPLCTSIESQRALHGPAAAAKDSDDEATQLHLQARRDMITVRVSQQQRFTTEYLH